MTGAFFGGEHRILRTFLAVAVLLLVPVTAEAVTCVQWTEVTGSVYYTGPTTNLLVKSPVYAVLTDGEGRYSSKPSHLKVKNNDSHTAAGETAA